MQLGLALSASMRGGLPAVAPLPDPFAEPWLTDELINELVDENGAYLAYESDLPAPAFVWDASDPASWSDNGFAFSRASSGLMLPLDGTNWSSASTNVMAYNTGGPLAGYGELYGAWTNHIRNNSGTGAAAGTPGTAPYNMTVASSGSGLTREIVAVGTVDGLPYIDIRYYGTASTNLFLVLFRNHNALYATAAPNDWWTVATHLALVSGSLSGVGDYSLVHQALDSSGSSLNYYVGSGFSINSALTRYAHSAQLVHASTARVLSYGQVQVASGNSVDFTTRVAGAMMVQAPYVPRGVILTSGSAVTLATDVVARTSGAPNSGTAIIEFASPGQAVASVSRFALRIGTATGNRVGIEAGSNVIRPFRHDGTNGFGIVSSSGLPVLGTPMRIGLRWSPSLVAAVRDGGSVSTLATALTSFATASTLLSEGSLGWSGGTKRLRVYDQLLSDAQMQALTAP